jgi:heavy metal translocating P-type ATPase
MLGALRWQMALVFFSLDAIVLYVFALYYPLGVIYGMPTQELVLLTVAVLGGTPLILQILLKLFKGQFGADLLAAIAIFTAVYVGEYLAANLIVLMLAGGQVFESYAVRKASSVLLALADRMPSTAHRKSGGEIQEIQLMDIQVGDLIVIYPHEVCPVDGTVVEGHGSMDESYLTGEPYSVSKIPGTTVISGATNSNELLVIKATSLPQDSRYSNIMKVMEDAEQHRPELRRLGDQIGAIFTPFALLIAFAAWYLTGDSVRFLAVLVIATPCPLLIAIPITIISAISLASRKGIIIKDPIVLERLPTCQTAIFDKTGTLTYGKAELVDINTVGDVHKDLVLQLAASLERYSKHPLAMAVVNACLKAKLPYLDTESIAEPAGQGLTGNVSGRTVQITDRKHLAKQFPKQVKSLPPMKAGLECLVLVDNKVAATLQFRDTLRLEGSSFIHHLGPMHHFNKTMIVSGDRAEEVEYLAKQLGITVTYGNQTPEQKVEIVRRETLLHPTLYIGDGVNDAPAILSATVGLAFGHSSNVTSEAGGAVIFDSSLAKVDELLHISDAMRRIALQSALGGMGLSIIGMIFAAYGFIPPVAGALLQEGIDVLAILNSLRLTWQSNIQPHIKEPD